MNEKQLIKKWHSNAEYYNSDIIRNMKSELNHKVDIALIYSGRKRGKSFDISAKAIKEAYYSNGELTFGYIRRYDKEITNYKVEQYFADKIEYIKDLTDNKANCIICEKSSIYLGFEKFENGKIVKEKIMQIGNTFAVNLSTQYKSLQFPKIHTLIFEEVFTNDGYISDEPNKLLSIISTVQRNKEEFITFLVSNTVSKINPYTQAFSLKGILKQKSGTIDEYRLYKGTIDNRGMEEYYYICVEYLKDLDNEIANSKKNKKRNRIISSPSSNKWEEAYIYPTIPIKIIKEFETLYSCVFEYADYRYLCELKRVPINLQEVYEHYIDSDELLEFINESMEVCYISRKTSKILSNTRLYTTNPIVLPNATRGYFIINEYDEIIDKLLNVGHCFFADNLTGNEFKQCIDELKKFSI